MLLAWVAAKFTAPSVLACVVLGPTRTRASLRRPRVMPAPAAVADSGSGKLDLLVAAAAAESVGTAAKPVAGVAGEASDKGAPPPAGPPAVEAPEAAPTAAVASSPGVVAAPEAPPLAPITDEVLVGEGGANAAASMETESAKGELPPSQEEPLRGGSRVTVASASASADGFDFDFCAEARAHAVSWLRFENKPKANLRQGWVGLTSLQRERNAFMRARMFRILEFCSFRVVCRHWIT